MVDELEQQMDVREWDVVVVGAGATGENAADRASRTGLSVVVIEDALVGGECSYWACMPSKALLRPGAVLAAARGVPGAAGALVGGVDVAATFTSRDAFTSHWDDRGQVAWLESAGIDLLRGRARFVGERTVLVTATHGEQTFVRARHAVVLAAGSEAVLPEIDGLAEVEPWTSRDATSSHVVPSSLAVLGGGVVGVEMAVAYADLGSRVSLLVRGDRLLTRAEPFVGEELTEGLDGIGVDVRFSVGVTSARRDADGVHLSLSDGSELVAAQVLVATGRRPRTEGLGLEAIGLAPGAHLDVDDALEVVDVPGGWLFAAGDLSGRTMTTHQGKYDARVAGDVIAARFGTDAGARTAEREAAPWSRYRATADHTAVPQVVFSRPEAAWVGRSEREARQDGIRVRVVRHDIATVSGAALEAQGYAGTAQLVLDEDTTTIVGATFTGPDAPALVHAATVAVVGQVPLDRLWHAVPVYPTVAEVWLRLLEDAGL